MISLLKDLTLADFFAAEAMGQFFARNRSRALIVSPEEVAKGAYEFADAMILQRKKRHEISLVERDRSVRD